MDGLPPRSWSTSGMLRVPSSGTVVATQYPGTCLRARLPAGRRATSGWHSIPALSPAYATVRCSRDRARAVGADAPKMTESRKPRQRWPRTARTGPPLTIRCTGLLQLLTLNSFQHVAEKVGWWFVCFIERLCPVARPGDGLPRTRGGTAGPEPGGRPDATDLRDWLRATRHTTGRRRSVPGPAGRKSSQA